MKSNDLKLNSIIKSMLNEEIEYDAPKVASDIVNALSGINVRHRVNDSFLKQKEEELRKIRIEIMEYIEQNSNYTWYGKSPSGFKLVKKK